MVRRRAQPFGGMKLKRQTLQGLLERHSAQLAACKQALRVDLPASAADVRDVVEDGVDHLSRAIGAALLEASASTVRGIESALARLKRNAYGKCSDCRQPIPAARLQVLPFAERCRGCQDECERGMLEAIPAH
jgi:RNA polymerase-binding transcription factor DksA